MTHCLSSIEQDIPRELAVRAYEGISFSPERRGDSDIQEYMNDIRSDYAELEELCQTDEHREILDALFPHYREVYARLYRGYLATKARTISPMITGPARFPVDRNQKIMRSEHNKLDALIEFRKRTIARIRKQILHKTPEEQQAADATRLETMKKTLETMKAANKILRAKKPTMRDDLIALPLKPETADKLISTPDCFGNIGFASFELTSIREKIKRMESKQVQAAKPRGEKETIQGDECLIIKNPSIDRVQVIFPSKPDRPTIDKLKSYAFRWSPSNKAWQRQLTRNGIDAAMVFATPSI